jgi:hypothetical protein
MRYEYFQDPSPHLSISEVVPSDLYRVSSFPAIPKSSGGRVGRDLLVDDPGFHDLVMKPGWREIYQQFQSESLFAELVSLFQDDMIRFNCQINAKQVRLEHFCEPRSYIGSRDYDIDDTDPHSLFVRFDLQAADGTYRPYVHLDHPRRLISGLLFFCDASEEGLVGGEFALFRDLEFSDDRICHVPQIAKKFPIKHNTGVLFLNCNTGFHGPCPILTIVGLRRWVYFSISSHRSIWPVRGLQYLS